MTCGTCRYALASEVRRQADNHLPEYLRKHGFGLRGYLWALTHPYKFGVSFGYLKASHAIADMILATPETPHD